MIVQLVQWLPSAARQTFSGLHCPNIRRAEVGCAGVSRPSEHVKDFVAAIDFHLVDHREQYAEAAFWKAAFCEKPSQIFRGKLVDRQAGRGIMFRSVLPERHCRVADFP
jgi:hypothetical protein